MHCLVSVSLSSPREWWKFAISVILRDIRERTGQLSCQLIILRAFQYLQYVDIAQVSQLM